jgi:threonine/homoserine/homoserine lactone efflux protein
VFSLLLRGFALGFAVAASPGPIFFLCIRRTLASGRLTGLFSGFGVATVDGFYAAIATFGVAALTSAFVAGRRPLAIIGGAVLIALGARILLERKASSGPGNEPVTKTSLAWAYASTVGLTITNPATILSFAALAAALGLGTSGSLVKPAAVTLGVLCGSAAWWLLLVSATSVLRTRMTPRVLRGLSLFSGAAIVLLGILAAISAVSG